MRATRPALTAHDRLALLARLYKEQIEKTPSQYLIEHGAAGAITHHVNVFEWYLSHLKGREFLDWGCNHGPDSCLLRQHFGDAVELHACDFPADDDFRAFRDYARPHYKQLTDPLYLPYENQSFDAIIGGGVLEHTAMEGEALKELYRVLRPDGTLVITYLPYAYSWDEWRRRAKKTDYHKRLFTKQQFSRVLLSHGFEPLDIRFQGYVPHRFKGRRPLWWSLLRPLLHPIVDTLWNPLIRPVRYPFFGQTVLCGIARKFTVL